MKQTVVGVFDRIDAARQAADSLGVSGFGEGSVHVSAATGDEGALAGAPQRGSGDAHEVGGVMDGLRSFFAEVFGPGDSHQHEAEYAEAVRRGAVVVKVDVQDEARLDIARETLQSAGAIDIEERVAEWREGGWAAGNDLPGAGAASVLPGTGLTGSMPTTRPADAAGAVSRGRVRVYSHNGAHDRRGGMPEEPAQRPLDLGDDGPKTDSLVSADGSAPKVDALELLASDHSKVRQLFKDYERLTEFKAQAAERQPLAESICVQLTVHAALEEEIFYPAARAALMPTDLVDEASVEHASARELIERIRDMDAEEELYDATVRVLGEYIDHHVREEEDQLFPAARGASLDLAGLGLEMSDRKAELLAQFGREAKV
ncbi:hemerythrin domain-containing protein [Methylibium sp.]|uniref:hemerythrin domain-containing protein n=1 Tax=Methylibium sp. TaxID=2067992 RepID=UPI0025D23DA1|nr:hemerythrin domain-containing protein [Methylibium sp.]